MRKRIIKIGIFGLIMILGLLSPAILVAGQEHQITGHVYEEGTSWGIDGADVHIEGDSSWDITTDSNGYYSIWVPNGGYSISVSATGYYDQDAWVNVEGESVTQDFYLFETYGDGNGGDGNDGDGNGENDISEEFSQLGDQVGSYLMICGTIFIVLVIAFLVMAISSVGIFVRLGKIRKELKSSKVQQQAQQSQQPLPPTQPVQQIQRPLPPAQQATVPQIPPVPVNNQVQQQPDAQVPNEQQTQHSQGDAP